MVSVDQFGRLHLWVRANGDFILRSSHSRAIAIRKSALAEETAMIISDGNETGITCANVPSHVVPGGTIRHLSFKDVYLRTKAIETMHALICVAIIPNMRVTTMTFLLLQGNGEVRSKLGTVERLGIHDIVPPNEEQLHDAC
jgi:hypothetical protein